MKKRWEFWKCGHKITVTYRADQGHQIITIITCAKCKAVLSEVVDVPPS